MDNSENMTHQSCGFDAMRKRLDLVRAEERLFLVGLVALQHRVAGLLADGLSARMEKHIVDGSNRRAEAVLGEVGRGQLL
jgi:hypothetical protein